MKNNQENLDVLELIFGSASKVKIMRLFLFNPTEIFDFKTIMTRSQAKQAVAKQELMHLEKAGMIKKRPFTREEEKSTGQKPKKPTVGWLVDKNFPYYTSLYNLLVSTSPLRFEDVIRKVSKAGKIKLLIVAGVFIQQPDSRIDMLVVGDHLKERVLEKVLKEIESEVGTEIRYTVLTTDDYEYRLGMCDKLVRDVLDFPHEVIIDRFSHEM